MHFTVSLRRSAPLCLLFSALWPLTPARALTQFETLCAGSDPVSGFLAGNGIVTGSTVPETDEWNSSLEGSPATSVSLSNPHIAMADALGNVFIADKASHQILKVGPDGHIGVFAGS